MKRDWFRRAAAPPAAGADPQGAPAPPPPARWGFWNVDLLILGWMVLVLVTVGLTRARIDRAADILREHATYAVGYVAMVRILARTRASEFVGAVARFGAIVVLFFVTFLKLGHIIRGLNPETRELDLLAADRWLFGTDPLLVLEPWLHPVAVDFFEAAYFSYFVTPLVVMAVLVARKDVATMNRLYLGVLMSLFASYVGYVLVPARSPYLAAEDPAMAWAFPYTGEVRGWVIGDWIRATIESWDTVKLNAFPSGHAAVAVVFLVLLWRCPGVRWVVIPSYLALIVSTVYLRYHYVVDVGVGVVLGVASAWLARRLSDVPSPVRMPPSDWSARPPPPHPPASCPSPSEGLR